MTSTTIVAAVSAWIGCFAVGSCKKVVLLCTPDPKWQWYALTFLIWLYERNVRSRLWFKHHAACWTRFSVKEYYFNYLIRVEYRIVWKLSRFWTSNYFFPRSKIISHLFGHCGFWCAKARPLTPTLWSTWNHFKTAIKGFTGPYVAQACSKKSRLLRSLDRYP